MQAAISRLAPHKFASNDSPTVSDRLWDSVAARICEQQKRAFRCIVSDLGETHCFRTWQWE
jgi:hypothetical protein